MATLVHILRYKAFIFWTASRPATWKAFFKGTGSSLVYLIFGFGAFFFSRFVTSFLLHNLGIGLFLLHRFVGMLLFVLFVAINVGNIVVGFATLYRSEEVGFLMTHPVEHRTVFLTKFLDNFFYSSGTLLSVGIAVLLGYGSVLHLPWTFYCFAIAGVMLPFMFLAGCLGILLLLLLMTVVERIGVKNIIALLVLAYCAQIYLYFVVSNPVQMANEVMGHYPYVNRYFGNLDSPAMHYIPSFWVSQIFLFFVRGQISIVAGYTALLLLTCTAGFLAVLLAGEKLYYRTWLTSLSLRSILASIPARGRTFGFERVSRLRPAVEVVLKKEFWSFVREPSQWIHFAVMMVLVILFVGSVMTLNLKLIDPMLRTVIYLLVFVFDAFLIASVALRFAFPVVSMEGKAYWSLRSAPVAPASVYWLKWSVTFLGMTLLGLVIAFLSQIPYRHLPLLGHVGVPSIVLVAGAMTSLNFGMGAYFADFEEKNPIRIASSQGATITFLLTLVYLVFLLTVFFIPTYAVFRGDLFVEARTVRWMYVAFGVHAAGALVVAVASHSVGLRSLKRDFA